MEIVASLGTQNRIGGQKFGKLTAIEQSTVKRGRVVLWRCVCDCGNECFHERNKLRTGRVKSCGCLVDEKLSQRIKPMQRFGRLVAIERTLIADSKRNRLWRCICDCGNEVFQPLSLLITGNTSSCGCLRSEIESANLRAHVQKTIEKVDLTGKEIGLLYVEKKIGQDKNAHFLYRCICACGNERVARRKDLLRRHQNTLRPYPKSCGCRGRGLIEEFKDVDGLLKWRMIKTKQIVSLDLNLEGKGGDRS